MGPIRKRLSFIFKSLDISPVLTFFALSTQKVKLGLPVSEYLKGSAPTDGPQCMAVPVFYLHFLLCFYLNKKSISKYKLFTDLLKGYACIWTAKYMTKLFPLNSVTVFAHTLIYFYIEIRSGAWTLIVQ